MSTKDVSRRRFMLTATGAALAAGAAAQPVTAQDEEDGGGEGEEGGEGEDGGEEGGEGGEGGDGEEGGEGEEGGDGEEGEDGEDGGGGGGNEVPDFGSYLSDANGFDEASILDARGEDEVTISVGAGDGYAFDPAGVWVDPGTTIVWEWTGEGGGHNIAIEEGEAGYEHPDTVEEEGYTHEYEVTEEDAGISTYKCDPHEQQGMKGGVAVGDDVETVEVDTGAEGPDITIPDQALALTTATFIAMASTMGLGYFLMKFGGDYEHQE